MSRVYVDRLIAGDRPIGSSTEHYWRWPIGFHWRWLLGIPIPRRRWLLGVSIHGVRDGVVRGLGPFHPAVRTLIWFGPIGVELGWRRQAIENWRWRRALRRGEGSA